MTRPPTEDRAVLRRWFPEPAESYRARRHALELIEGGSFLGAWGAVRHLHEDEVQHEWTRVVEWLSLFAASLPLPDDCNIRVLEHPLGAVRTALRVELALRAGDIPRAVHGTVAFFEAALWDHLGKHVRRHTNEKKRRLFRVTPEPKEALVGVNLDDRDYRKMPFKIAEEENGVRWYRIADDNVCAIRIARNYLQCGHLEVLGNQVAKVRDLRNDVAHNEPTPQFMAKARDRMAKAGLWAIASTGPSFLGQALIVDVLKELGYTDPEWLCDELMKTVRETLVSFGGLR